MTAQSAQGYDVLMTTTPNEPAQDPQVVPSGDPAPGPDGLPEWEPDQGPPDGS